MWIHTFIQEVCDAFFLYSQPFADFLCILDLVVVIANIAMHLYDEVGVITAEMLCIVLVESTGAVTACRQQQQQQHVYLCNLATLIASCKV